MMRPTQHGFTLLEVIIAITLASLATLLGASILRMGGDFYQRAHAYIGEQQELRGALRLIRQEIQAVPKGTVGLRGNAAQIDLLSEKPPLASGRVKPTLISLGCMETAPGRYALVHLMRIEPGQHQQKQLAEAQLKAELAQLMPTPGATAVQPPPLPQPLLAEGGPQEPVYEQEVLMRALTQCSFAYLARDEKQRVAVWLEEWGMEKKVMPLAVSLRVATTKGLLPAVVIPLK